MAIDYTSMIQQRLPGLVSRGSLPIEQQSFARNERFARLLEMLRGPEPEVPDPTSQVAAARSGALPGAEPEEESGFNIFNSLFSVLDAFGRPIRGLLGAGTAAAKGDFDKAGSRLKDAALAPIDSLTFNIFDVAKEQDNTTGSDILNDLGWKAGTTTEDERRIRIAMAAGLSRRDAMRQFGVHGDRRLPQEVAESFENIIQEAKKRNPEIELNATMDDFKNAVDAQDFAGFAVEVLTDPLTYMSMGATAVGKAARTVGTFAKHAPEMVQAIRGAGKLDDALKAIRGASKVTSKQKKRLEKLVTRAWKQVPEGERPSLYMADNWAKQVREGQRAMFVTLGGRPIVKGGPVAEVLSYIGQTKTAEEILGSAKPKGGIAGAMIELPGVKQVVGGVKGLVRFTRDKMDTKTGVNFIDELMLARDADSREGLTQIGRLLNEMEDNIRTVAKGSKAKENELKQQAAKAIELSKQTGGDMQEAAEAARVSLGISNSVMETEAVAKVAAGIVRINETILDKASKVPTRIRELNDDTIQYLHRMLTPEAREFFKNSGKRSKFASDTGLEFNARSRTFKRRNDTSRGRTLDEINAEFKEKHGINLFNPDPIASTRESVRLTQRAIANAKFGEAFVREYGQATTDELNLLLDSIDGIPERLLNMRKGAELDAATTKAAARAAREEGKTHIGEVARRLEKTRAKGVVDPETVPEGLDVMATAAYFKQVLKDNGMKFEGEVSAFDIYNRLGLKLPDNPEDLAKLVSVTVPEESAAFVTRALKLQEDPHVFWQYYDRYTQWAKATVTVLFPAFHGRNMLENTFKNFIEGNTNLNNYRNATKLLAQAADLAAGSPDWVGRVANKVKRAFQKAGEPDKAVLNELAEAGVGRTYAEIADWLVANGILDNRITSEFGEVLQEGIEGATTLGHRARGLGGRIATELGTQGGAVRGGFALSAGTENLHRVSLFLDRIGKGYNPFEAAAEVKRVFFDYRALTNLESTYLKRMGFFYSFYRNNLRYIMQQFFTRPELTKQTLRLFTNDPDNPKQRWLSDKASFTAGAKEVALGFIPQGQFNMFGFEGEDIVDKVSGKAGDILGMGNPAIAMPLEVAFNKDLFTGGPLFGEAASVDWSFAPQEVQDFIGYHQTEDGRHKVGRLWNLLTGAAPVIGRFSSTAIQLTSKERVYWEKLTRVFTGLNIQDRDLEKEDLALIDRNLMRASRDMQLVKRDVRGNYRVNTETAQGRVASALLFPSKEKITDLGLAPEILFTLKPYMTFDKEGKVRLTDALRLKMHEVATQMFPQERAFFDAVEGRKAVVASVQGRTEDKLGGQAMDAFNEFLTGTR